jgi:hypothetical protein
VDGEPSGGTSACHGVTPMQGQVWQTSIFELLLQTAVIAVVKNRALSVCEH